MRALFILLLCAHSLSAQPVRAQVLSQPWRFHTGDDPQWKDPAFDDSGWPAILPTRRWTDQGVVTHSSRFAWYRLPVTIDTAEPLYLWFPELKTAGEVFVNGTKVMQYGVPGDVFRSKVHAAPLAPLPPFKPGDRAVIAVRVWICLDDEASHLGGGISAAPELGPRAPMQRAIDLQFAQKQQEYLASLLTAALGAFLGAVFLFCWRRQPNHAEYAWYAGMLLGRAFFDFFWYGIFALGFLRSAGLTEGFGYAINLGCSYFFFRSYFKASQPRWHLWMLGLCLLLQVADGGGWVDWLTGFQTTVMLIAGQLPILLVNTSLLISQGRKGNRDAMALGVPYFVYASGLIVRFVWFALIFSGLQGYLSFPNNGFILLREPIFIPLELAGLVLGSVAMAGILLDRFTRTAQEGERMAKELEAARQVQELLLPSAAAQVPGFAIESVYLPANEVGGDFYQVLPCDDGGVLVVTGDVSGKGLKAAMIVSAAVGAIGMTATRDPAALLAELNRSFAGRLAGGFVTCCAVLISKDGNIRVANAGHIPPYVAGRQMEVESCLPLGLSIDAVFVETAQKLPAGEQMVLLSDGVVEATNENGELFGFERTREISGKSAQEIAEGAKSWGQNDDITVLTIRNLGHADWRSPTA